MATPTNNTAEISLGRAGEKGEDKTEGEREELDSQEKGGIL